MGFVLHQCNSCELWWCYGKMSSLEPHEFLGGFRGKKRVNLTLISLREKIQNVLSYEPLRYGRDSLSEFKVYIQWLKFLDVFPKQGVLY